VVVDEFEQAVAAAEFELGAHVLPVRVDGADRAPEEIGDFFAGPIFRDQFEDAALGRGERGQAGFLTVERFGPRPAAQQQAREFRADEGSAGGHGAHGAD